MKLGKTAAKRVNGSVKCAKPAQQAAGMPGGMSLGGETGMVLLEEVGSHPVKGDGRDRAGLRQMAWAGARSEMEGTQPQEVPVCTSS